VNIAIIGGGSLGLLLSCYLQQNHKVTLYVRREEQKNAIEAKGITLQIDQREKKTSYVTARMIEQLKSHDITFVTVKQPQLRSILDTMKVQTIDTSFIFVQNGMGHIDVLQTLEQPVYIGVVEHGAKRIDDVTVHHLGVGSISLASFNQEADALESIHRSLQMEDFPFKIKDDWRRLLEEKLLINAVINPLTAIFNVPNGHIVTEEPIQKLAKQLAKEAAYVLHFDEDQAWERVKQVALNTAQNTSSMRADLLQKRETEIEAISGYLLRQVEVKHIPYTSFVYYAILALEERGS